MLCSNILGWYQYCTILWLTRLDLSLRNTINVNCYESTKIIPDSEVLSAYLLVPYPNYILSTSHMYVMLLCVFGLH